MCGILKWEKDVKSDEKGEKWGYVIKKTEFPCIIEKKVVILQPDLVCGIVYAHEVKKNI